MQTLSMADMYCDPGFGAVLDRTLRFLERTFKTREDPSPKGISPSYLASLIPASE